LLILKQQQLKNKTAVIIGAGPAGLTAAYELLTTTDYIPVIIESDKQVGGISKTIDYKGNKIDIGGHRFFSKSERVVQWWLNFLPLKQEGNADEFKISYHNKEAIIKNAGQYNNDERVMFLRPRKSRILFRKKFFDYPLKLNIKTIKNLGLVKLFRVGFSYMYAKIFPVKDEKNLAQFFRNRFGKELYLTFFKDYTEKVWGVKCEDIPSEWGRQRVKDLNISKVLKNALRSFFVKDTSLTQKDTSTSLIEQFLYPKYGPGQMWETVADEILKAGGKILLNTEVKKIKFCNDEIIESVTVMDLSTGNSAIIKGDVFFSTMPVKTLIKNAAGTNFTEHVNSIAEGLQYRDFLIVGLLLDKLLFTDNDSLDKKIKDNWIYLQDKGIKAGRVQIFNNWSPFMVNDPDKIWIGAEFFCSENEPFWQQSDDLIIAQAIKEMKQIGLIDDNDVKDAVVIKVLKAYPSYYGTYSHFDDLRVRLNEIVNLYCIGRNGMHKYNNSDHSMITAMESVKHLNNGGDKNAIWDINTEDDYHEEK
jgi:protoporphyrinogen oxidase